MKAKSSDPVSLPLSVRIKSLLAHLSLALVSAGLMVLAYPKTDAWPLAWFGLVPLLLALDGKRPGAAYGLGWVFGCAFFGGTLYWLMHVTGFGMALLVMFLANYIGLFALGHSLWRKRPLMEKIFLYPALWTALEFIRDRFLSGFGWASLGHSQYLFLPVIQMADITGMFGVSFLVLMANVAIKETLRPSGGRRESRKAGLTLAMILAAVLVYGVFRLNPAKPDPTLRVAIVQPNIPQEMKWQSSAWPVNMEKMKELTLRAAETRPDLIIWPETSYPGYIWDSPALYEDMKQFMAGVKVPLLFGAHTKIGDSYFNSAVLFDSAGQETAQYDKLHLVPFGEYLPLRRAWPFLEEIVPIEDFTAGRKQTVFTIPDGKGQTLSVLICFEDTMARLAREFVNSGARLLVNITNDAWFQDTKAPFMHLQAAVFRTVENRRALVRASNTGVSCFISKTGKIYKYLESNGKKTFVDGVTVADVGFSGGKTFYTKSGDVFTYFCFGVILWGIITGELRRKKPGPGINR